MIYLIGGPPRVGKTTLVKNFVQAHPMHAVSTDAIRYMLRRAVPREALNPDIFLHFDTDVMDLWDESSQETLEMQNRESKALWPAMREFIHSYNEDGIDLLVEGVAITPDFSDSLDVANRSIFIGNCSDDHIEVIKEAAHRNEHDWMHQLPEEKVQRAAEFFKLMSKYYENQSKEYGLPYCEIKDNAFHESLENAAKKLLT